jgi:hypothetical protein
MEQKEKLIGEIYLLPAGGIKSVVVADAFEENPPAWGLAIADFLSTTVKAVSDAYQVPEPKVFEDIRELFDKEMARPTTDIKMGRIHVT